MAIEAMDEFDDMDIDAGEEASGNAAEAADGTDEGDAKDGTTQQQDAASSSTDDEDDYGKRVQRRISKLVAERNAERAERERIAADMQQLASRLEQIEQHKNQSEEQNFNAYYANIKQARRAALEAGDMEKFDELDEQLREADIYRHTQRRQQPVQQERVQREAAPQQSAPQQPQVNQHAQAWLQRNNWYFQDAKRARIAQDIEKQLLNEGYGYDDDLYEELDRRMSQKPKAQSPVAAPNRGQGTDGPKNGKQITREDLSTMRKYGLDPNNPKHRKEWMNRNADL